MKRSEIRNIPPFYDTYINQVEDIDILRALENYDSIIDDEGLQKCNMLQDEVYEEGKWTVRDIFQHIIDTERIMAYRALRFARYDQTVLPGFDENHYAEFMRSENKSINTLAIEFNLLRRSNTLMFKEFQNVVLKRKGFVDKTQISVLALGFVIVGHQKHHIGVIKDKYFPLID
ncbi:MAG: DinB family protein [Chitinophagales bacterium]|jgi:hypothetical protein